MIEISNWSKHQRVDNKGRSQLAGFLAPPAEDRSESPRLADVRGLDLGPGTKDQGPGSGSARARGVSEAEAQLENQCGFEHWPDVRKFLDARPPGKRVEWAAEVLRIIGPTTGNLPADLARACREGLLAAYPVTSALGLQRFTATCRRERTHPGSAAPTSVRPSKQETGRANTASWLAKKELEQEPA